MFRPVPMQWITLLVLKDDTPDAAVVVARCGILDPDAAEWPNLLPDLPGKRFAELYGVARGYLDKILAHCPRSDDRPRLAGEMPDEAQLEALGAWLRTLWLQCSNCQESSRRAEEERSYVAQLVKMLDRFAVLGIDLGLLTRSRQFLDVHIGMMPSAHVARVREAVALAGYVLTPLTEERGVVQAVVAGPKGREAEVGAALRAADWEAARLPASLEDGPQAVRRRLLEHQDRVVAEANTRCRQVEMMRQEFGDRLVQAADLLAMAAPYAELGEVARGRGGLTQIGGWAPASELAGLRSALRDRFGSRFVLNARVPRPDETGRVPSLLRHSALLRPFAALVSNYGVPRYGEIDPTLLFAASFVIMFGMMFGDIGNGVLIAVVGALAARRLHGLAPFVIACGLASAGFGWAYGSVFGFEELVHPLWIAPLADPERMLVVALYWGIGFILVAGVLSMGNCIIGRRYRDALLDGKGLAGLVLYAAVLLGLRHQILGTGPGGVAWVTAAAALTLVFGYHWYQYSGKSAEGVLVAFAQSIEDVIGYFSNTLSFLRVAAFELNHVVLAAAVLALASMAQGRAGNWIAVVLGNIFIMVLEGAIVAIQVLRLEYYEGLSRYFGGSGREFRPLTLDRGGVPAS